MFRRGGNPGRGTNELGKVGRHVSRWSSDWSQAERGALHVEGDHQTVSRATRETVNSGDNRRLVGYKPR